MAEPLVDVVEIGVRSLGLFESLEVPAEIEAEEDVGGRSRMLERPVSLHPMMCSCCYSLFQVRFAINGGRIGRSDRSREDKEILFTFAEEINQGLIKSRSKVLNVETKSTSKLNEVDQERIVASEQLSLDPVRGVKDERTFRHNCRNDETEL